MFLQKYDEARANGILTHRVSDLFCGEQHGSLRLDFEQWAHRGLMSIELRTWMTAYQLCCLDDGMQESPHGIITHIVASRPCSTPKCWSALYRYKQNLAAKRSLDINHPGRFNSLFQHWRMLFSKRSTLGAGRLIQPRKSIKRNFLEKVYRMNEFAYQNIGTMKKDQELFLRDSTDEVVPLSHSGKIAREYLRMMLQPRDIVSFFPYVPPVGADVGTVSSEAQDVSVLEPPELYSIISSDQHRLKTITTQSAQCDLAAPAPFMVFDCVE